MTGASRPVQDRWYDVEGTHIALFCWVEQVRPSPEPGALPSRLHKQGQVVGRGLDALYVQFSDHVVVSVSPQLLRLLPDAPGGC